MGLFSFPTALQPILFVLYVSGLYFLPAKNSKKWCYVLNKILTVFFAVGCWVSVFVLAVGYMSSIVLGSNSNLYMVSNSIGSILLLLAFCGCCQKSFGAFGAEFESYQREHSRSSANYKSVFVLGILAIVNMIGHICVGLFYAFFPAAVLQCQLIYSVFPKMVGNCVCHPAFFGVVLFFTGQLLNASFYLYLCIWRILKVEANSVAEGLTKQDRQSLRKAPEVIESFRLRHADLCHVIDAANRFLRHILATFFGVGIVGVLTCVHGISSRSGVGGLAGLDNVFVVVLVILYLVIVTLTGVSLNLKMHEPVDFLFRLDVQRMTGKGSEIVSAFLSRVQGAPIGFNVYNLFTVDTSTIMMICGTILTYTLVIVQFQPLQLSTSSSTSRPPAVTSAYTEHDAYVNTTEM